MILELVNINKKIKNGREDRYVLQNLNLKINSGDSIAIKGRSGAGKTTLLNIISMIGTCNDGNIFFKEKNISNLSSAERLDFRRNNIGIITQQLSLLDDRNIFENVALPLYYQRLKKSEIKKRVKNVLDLLNMGQFMNSKITNLSGGERQRIAIARALVKNPLILIADEPTGSLDERTEKEILNIFSDLQKQGMTIIIVTHNAIVAESCNYIYELVEGKLIPTN